MSNCYRCGKPWTNENKIETPLFCPDCKIEWKYIFNERLGMNIEDRQATQADIKLAEKQADEICKEYERTN